MLGWQTTFIGRWGPVDVILHERRDHELPSQGEGFCPEEQDVHSMPTLRKKEGERTDSKKHHIEDGRYFMALQDIEAFSDAFCAPWAFYSFILDLRRILHSIGYRVHKRRIRQDQYLGTK